MAIDVYEEKKEEKNEEEQKSARGTRYTIASLYFSFLVSFFFLYILSSREYIYIPMKHNTKETMKKKKEENPEPH